MSKGPAFKSDKYMVRYFELAERLAGPPYPLTDSEGNGIANIIPFNITGTTHRQTTGNPQKYIPKLVRGDRLVLVPNPDNEFDSQAIRIMTFFHNQIGWYPQNAPHKNDVFMRLMDEQDVYADVFHLGKNRNSATWWCEIRTFIYGV